MGRALSRRYFVRLAGAGAAGTALVGLAGCGSAGSGSGSGLTVWDYYGPPDSIYGRALQDLYERYMKANPKISVDKRFVTFDEFNRLLLQSGAGGNLPDVALANAFDTGKFAKAGVAKNLSSRVEKWGKADTYFETSWGTTVWQGDNCALPHVADCYVLWYNVDHFREAGFEQPPQTWQQLGSMASKLSNGDRIGFAFSAVEGVQGATAWVIRFLAAGGDITKVASPAGEAALQQWVDLVKSGATSASVLEWIEEDTYNRFKAGKASMMLQSASYVNVLKEEAPNLNWTVALLPEDTQRASFLSAENLVITNGTQNADAAWDLVTYMQQPDVLKKYLPERNKLPARKDLAQDPLWTEDPVWSVFVEQLPTAWAPENEVAVNSSEIFTYVQEAIQVALSGSASVRQALGQAQRNIDEVMAA
ncbi:extracellular solute-binding protein [Haloactinomyces albus]|uniref:Multiple sugar transport system substrate-binding protein n=1 Tax=Haloactinomyces albus TaxID=1352928 RepID=A0AAE3ZEN8_9ACTN|nr:extracellular solute-binding protein [Haloactinomyces albus]MDR7303546.1 multiple sugar transport system substrate-binding protein [Haloactinomyces albus]